MKAELILRGKGFRYVVPLGDGEILPTAGGPNIEETAVPERPAFSTVAGRNLIRLDVPAFWDGWADGTNVQPDVMDVVDLALELPLADFTAEGPMPYSGQRFLMEAPEWQLIKRREGAMLQVGMVLKLVEFNDPTDLHPHKHGRHGGTGDGGTRAPATITLKQPENLVEVAAHYAGDPAEAKAIGNANGIHDIKKTLPRGTRLKIPAG